MTDPTCFAGFNFLSRWAAKAFCATIFSWNTPFGLAPEKGLPASVSTLGSPVFPSCVIKALSAVSAVSKSAVNSGNLLFPLESYKTLRLSFLNFNNLFGSTLYIWPSVPSALGTIVTVFSNADRKRVSWAPLIVPNLLAIVSEKSLPRLSATKIIEFSIWAYLWEVASPPPLKVTADKSSGITRRAPLLFLARITPGNAREKVSFRALEKANASFNAIWLDARSVASGPPAFIPKSSFTESAKSDKKCASEKSPLAVRSRAAFNNRLRALMASPIVMSISTFSGGEAFAAFKSAISIWFLIMRALALVICR